MNSIIFINTQFAHVLMKILGRLSPIQWVALMSSVMAICATIFSYSHGYIISYGDAESHLNIAKRVKKDWPIDKALEEIPNPVHPRL